MGFGSLQDRASSMKNRGPRKQHERRADLKHSRLRTQLSVLSKFTAMSAKPPLNSSQGIQKTPLSCRRLHSDYRLVASHAGLGIATQEKVVVFGVRGIDPQAYQQDRRVRSVYEQCPGSWQLLFSAQEKLSRTVRLSTCRP